MVKQDRISEEFEAGYKEGKEDTLTAMEGFIEQWSQVVGEDLDPIVATQLAEHKTPEVMVSILAEYWSIWEWSGNPEHKQQWPSRWDRMGKPDRTTPLQREIEDQFIQPCRQKLIAMHKILVQIPTAMESPPKDPRELEKWMQTHTRKVKFE